MSDADSFQELWATYSVRDHVQPWAFVADVLLYDKLVVPVPPHDEPDERERWVTERWDPERQERLLDVLGDLAERVPWDQGLRAQWGDDFAAERGKLGDQLAFERSLPYVLTGRRLMDSLPAMAQGVVATTTYTSVPEIETALELQRLPQRARLPAGTISAVLGTEFLIPADPECSELDLLRDAVSVARSTDYREVRAALHRFQERFIREDVTDLDSIKAAVAEMDKLSSNLRAATERTDRWSGRRRCLQFAQVSYPAAVALMTRDVYAAGEAAIGVGLYMTTNRLRDPSQMQGLAPEAALVVDAGRRLEHLAGGTARN